MRTPALQRSAVRLLPYQRQWIEDDSALKIVVKARQIGYSFSATLRALLQCIERKTTWIFLSKGERQSRLLMEKVQEHIQSCGIVAQAFESTFFEGTSQKQLEVRFPNGSVIYGLPSNPDTARGYSGNVTLDEFAFHADADKIYAALFPTITRGFSLEVISTPNGQQGKFFELAKAARLIDGMLPRNDGRGGACPAQGAASSAPTNAGETPALRPGGPAWSAHWCDIYEAVRQGLKINIQLLRSGCDDESTWQQEFCCQFVSTAENFFPPELLAACLSAEARTDASPRLLASARGARGEFYLGIDIGRQHDRTVFWLDEVTPPGSNRELRSAPADELWQEVLSSEFRVTSQPITHNPEPGAHQARAGGTPALRVAITRMVHTLDRTPFSEQLAFARDLLALRSDDGAPLVRRAAIDATGIGAMLAETLAAEFGPRVERVVFSSAVKEHLAFRTRRRLENRLSLLPDAREIRRAFSAIKKLVTPSGNLRFDAVRTASGHADEFWAKALADYAAEEPAASSVADGYLAPGAPIINPGAFREVGEGWPEVL